MAADPNSSQPILPLPSGKLIRLVFCAIFLSYLPFIRGHFFSVDEIELYHQTRSWWEVGNFATAPLQNTSIGRNGNYYAPYGVGQSLLALPLYGAGKWISNYMPSLALRLKGPEIGDNPEARWGGDVEIFCVLLLSTATVAALVALFAAFQMALGVSPRTSILVAFMLGFCSYPAGLSSSFFQHGLESLLLLWAFFFLLRHRRVASGSSLFAAGFCFAALVVVRTQAIVALPCFLLYLFLHQRQSYRKSPLQLSLLRLLKTDWPFLAWAVAGMFFVCIVNFAKFERFSLGGSYTSLVGFHTPLLLGLYGNVFSVSRSIFLFSPILFLAPWYFSRFWKTRTAETVTLLLVAVAYLGLYSKFDFWSGMWCFGPRYLAAIVPMLMLPLGTWLDHREPIARFSLAGLAGAGFLVAILHLLVNVSYVYHFEHWESYLPEFGYLFIPQHSQFAAHWRALISWDHRVDFWLLHYSRQFGMSEAAGVLGLMLTGAALAWHRTVLELRRIEQRWATTSVPVFSDLLTWPWRVLITAWLFTILLVSIRTCLR